MANNTAYVSAGKPKVGGAIYRAPLGTALPTDATTALDAAYKCTGYCSEDGLTEAETRDINEMKAWGGDVVGRSQTAYSKAYKFVSIETNVEVLKARYGDTNVTGTDGAAITIKHNAKELPRSVWVFEILLGDRVERKVIPDGLVSEPGDIVYNDNDPVGYEMTVATFPDAEGNYVYDYIAAVNGGSK